MTPLVSIAMATHNGEKYIASQIESILSQSYRDFELVVVDDASNDKTSEIVQNIAARDSRIRFYSSGKNLGIVLNFMKAVSMCQGELVAYSDQDDVWLADKIKVLAQLIFEHPENMLAYSDLEVMNESLNFSQRSFWRMAHSRPFSGLLGERALLKNLSPGCAMIFRRPVIQLISELYRDPEFCAFNKAEVLDYTPFMHDHLAQILASGLGRIVYTRQKLVRYRQHSANSIGASYQAKNSREGFIRSLLARTEALRPYRQKLNRIDWEKLDIFLEKYAVPGRGPMPKYLPYFLFLRNDGAWDKILGCIDCLTPALYQGIRQTCKK